MEKDTWLVDDKGRTVCARTDFWIYVLNHGKSDEEKFRLLQIATIDFKAPPNTVLIHRPSGGLGDLLCLLPAINRYILNSPSHKITIAVPGNYHWLFNVCFPFLTVVDYKQFHAQGFNNARSKFRFQFFLWCPAGMHEQECNYRPQQGRILNFANALSVTPLLKHLPQLNLSPLSKINLLWNLFKLRVALFCYHI